MRDNTFDSFTRRTVAALNRRSIFGVLGGALAATAIAVPESTAKGKKKCKGDNRICRSDTVDFCSQAPSEEEAAECRADLFKCCSQTALKCKGVGKFITCCHNADWPC